MKKLIIHLFTIFSLGLVFAPIVSVAAQTQPAQPAPTSVVDPKLKEQACSGASFGTSTTCDDKGFTGGFKTVVNVLIFIVGALSVLMIVIGAIRFVVSGGNDQAVQGARNTVLYAVIGLIVAFLAFAIVNFVISKL